MNLGADLSPHDRIHLDGELLAIGSFRLACDAPAFRAPKALAHHHIVLPRQAMGIVQDGRAIFVADPVMATLHDPGVPYWREPIGGQPDDSDYVVLQPQLVEELLGGHSHFDAGQCLLDAPTYAFGHALFDAARRDGAALPALALEEAALRFAAQALRGRRGKPARSARVVLAGARASAPRLDAVGRAKRALSQRLDRAPALAQIAREACVSPFHLTREFRVRTGLTLHQYAMALKTRHALLELERHEGRLERLAIDLGYAGLPHLSRHFKAAFGVGPREWLRRRSGLSESA